MLVECPICGLIGLHACPGYKLEPISKERQKEIYEIIEKIMRKEFKENE